MTAPCGWTLDPQCCDWSSYSAAVRTNATALATMIMWAATGRQFGKCSITVRPCRRTVLEPQYQTYPITYDGLDAGPYIENGEWHNACATSEASCSCSVDGQCSVLLDGPTTTADITSVTVAGALVDPAAYVVVDGNTLVRIDGECWPTCSPIASAIPEFEVEYLIGRDIPLAVQIAAERLACEYAKACTGGVCALPRSLKSLTRQGVEVEIADLPSDPNLIRTGIREVDDVIIAVNPRGLARRASVLSPDLSSPRRVS